YQRTNLLPTRRRSRLHRPQMDFFNSLLERTQTDPEREAPSHLGLRAMAFHLDPHFNIIAW
ncbi:hypothetical protein, partial [Mesorhizobium sp. M0013]|uniref:hypothetical protein n=1 Tax=Mesorhizobium sp. M0013 TaxID=2956841 RepID=UPI00333CD582